MEVANENFAGFVFIFSLNLNTHHIVQTSEVGKIQVIWRKTKINKKVLVNINNNPILLTITHISALMLLSFPRIPVSMDKSFVFMHFVEEKEENDETSVESGEVKGILMQEMGKRRVGLGCCWCSLTYRLLI